jgi:hypothetical protein
MGISSVLSLALVIFIVARVSRHRGGHEAALKEASKSLELNRKYIMGTRRPIYSGRRLIDRMRSWSVSGD